LHGGPDSCSGLVASPAVVRRTRAEGSQVTLACSLTPTASAGGAGKLPGVITRWHSDQIPNVQRPCHRVAAERARARRCRGAAQTAQRHGDGAAGSAIWLAPRHLGREPRLAALSCRSMRCRPQPSRAQRRRVAVSGTRRNKKAVGAAQRGPAHPRSTSRCCCLPPQTACNESRHFSGGLGNRSGNAPAPTGRDTSIVDGCAPLSLRVNSQAAAAVVLARPNHALWFVCRRVRASHQFAPV